MAKSKIIKDIANGSMSLETSLKRAKVLLSKFERKEVLEWIENELVGYKDAKCIPEYRKARGILRGDFLIGGIYNAMQYTNAPIPISKEIREEVEVCNIFQGIGTLKSMIDSGNANFGKCIPPSMYPLLQKDNNITSILSATVPISNTCILDIFAVVENKLLDIFMLLENEFGNLDDLDIDFSSKDEEEIRVIERNLYLTVFNDNSVSIGDNNKIKDSNISTAGLSNNN